jgi:predicted RNase H-like HicB family nuclease
VRRADKTQPIGWNPDLNDGVRMNIRPFVQAGILRKNPNIKWTKDRGGKRYTVSDGKLMLNLEEADEGGYIVTSSIDPELITEAETITEAFANARDAAKALKQSRARLTRTWRSQLTDCQAAVRSGGCGEEPCHAS